MIVPPLKDDCFAMPAGVDWTPVDDALNQIKSGLHAVVGTIEVPILNAAGRILSAPVLAGRDHPPMPNSAVDGYGFAHGAIDDADVISLPLIDGVAAAGQPFLQSVPAGSAIRILTGAVIPQGVDTVVLEEDTALDNGCVVFRSGLRAGANLRQAAEDVAKGAQLFSTGHFMRPQDVAMLVSVGVDHVNVYEQLKVAVISTGTEIVQIGNSARPDQIFDANKPMLLSLLNANGFDAIDGGHYPDDEDAIRNGLNQAAQNADAIFVSGGASAGDEDYVSKLLRSEGVLNTWRIAVKPGRPMAMALWNGTPTFGFPGNPVAAFVCALIFGFPAVKTLAGRADTSVQSFQVPAAFEKNKKPGRREYLRARLNEHGHAEVFKSEGSGRISGLAWATGLVELPDHACSIQHGSHVKYIPFSSF